MPASPQMMKSLPKLITLLIVIAASVSAIMLYQRWVAEPWTRDGQVRADIIRISPEVSGNLVAIHVKDNQQIHQGELLFEIDPKQYQLAVDQRKVALNQARENVSSLEASVRVASAQYQEAKVSLISAKRQIDLAEAQLKSTQAAIDQARAGMTSAKELINQRKAELDNAESEASRAQKLVEKKAGSVEDAESKAATVLSRKAQLASAEAGLQQSQASLTQAESEFEQTSVNLQIAKDAYQQSQAAEQSSLATLEQTKATLGLPGDENVRIQAALVQLAQAELDLKRTRIVSPCNGYISNLAVNKGSYAVVGQALVSVVNSDSIRVHAYFQETKLQHVQIGAEAVVTLMTHPNRPLRGVVETIGNAVNPPNIAPTEGVPGEVPQIAPTFDWVRLPQRVPVRIQLTAIPDDIQLISGTTASVSVKPPSAK